MYLKDPIKRVQYTFRIKEPLMEDLKVYAKAKDIKLPRLINDILEDHIKNMNLSNTWSNDPLDLFITIPKKYPKNIVNLPKGATHVDGWQFEVKAMPTNLDVWDDKKGYTSPQKDIKHEGVEPLLIPNYIEDITLKRDNETIIKIEQCLIGLYFIEYEDGTIRVDLIQFDDLIRKLQYAHNEILAKAYPKYKTALSRLGATYLDMLNDVNHDNIKLQLLDEMEDMAIGINTDNVVGVEINQYIEQPTPKYDASLPMYDLPKLLHEINELKKENAQYKEDIEKLGKQHEEMAKEIAKIDTIRKKLEELEAMDRDEIWELYINNKLK